MGPGRRQEKIRRDAQQEGIKTRTLRLALACLLVCVLGMFVRCVSAHQKAPTKMPIVCFSGRQQDGNGLHPWRLIHVHQQTGPRGSGVPHRIISYHLMPSVLDSLTSSGILLTTSRINCHVARAGLSVNTGGKRKSCEGTGRQGQGEEGRDGGLLEAHRRPTA